MQIEAPKNKNYCATVVRVKSIVPLEGRDRIVGMPMFGYQAIVSKDVVVGSLGVLFPAEAQLSEALCKNNNLFRHETLNADTAKKGYLEDNRRVRAMKFGGHRSDALFLPLSALAFTGFDVSALKEGDEFDALNGVEVCRKYVVERQRGGGAGGGNRAPKKMRHDARFFPEHPDTDNYFKYRDTIPAWAHIVVTQKLHGTSIRIANTVVERKLSWKDRVAKFFGVAVQETEYDSLYASRRVVRDPKAEHLTTDYLSKNLWISEGKRLDGLIPAGYIVYGEVIGWDGEKPIQQGYTYDCLPGTRKMYVYRVAHVNSAGYVADLGWDGVVEFCNGIGVPHVPLLWRGRHEDFFVQDFIDRRFCDEAADAVPLCEASPCDEGVCVRIDGIIPKIWKAKSPMFLRHETGLMDKGVVDVESQGDGVSP